MSDVSVRLAGGRDLLATAAFDALVLDGLQRSSVVTVRSLGRRGLSVAVLASVHTVPAFSSRWCQRGLVCPAAEATDAYLAYLEEALEHTGARVLIPLFDGTIALLGRHRARLEKRVRIALANEPALSIAVNKERTWQSQSDWESAYRAVRYVMNGKLPRLLRKWS